MHCGRVVHVANLPAGAEVLGPGAAVCPGEMYTDTLGMQREGFDGRFMLSGGFDHARAEQALLEKRGDLIAFGRPFLANPGLVARMHQASAPNPPDAAAFYVAGAKGYTDYPALAA
jgi:N-ethylmaleimide reductase